MLPNSLKAWRSESSLVCHERFLFAGISSINSRHENNGKFNAPDVDLRHFERKWELIKIMKRLQ